MRIGRFSWQTLGLGKRLFFVFGALAFLAFGVLAFVPFRKTSAPSARIPKTKEEVIASLQKDSDSDDLKDWEERIYGTKENNPDTDGDGTPDGEEIKASRNPLRAGPDDALTLSAPLPESTNLTNAIANELIGTSLTQILAKSLTGESLDPSLADPETLADSAAKIAGRNLLASVIPPETRDFKIISDNSPQAVKNYFNRVSEIYKKNFTAVEIDLAVFLRAMEKENFSNLAALEKNISAIEQAIADIKTTPTPSQWIDFAKEDVLYLSQSLAAVKILRSAKEDPAAALLILKERIAVAENLEALYRRTRIKLDAAGIAFEKSEPASFLLAIQ